MADLINNSGVEIRQRASSRESKLPPQNRYTLKETSMGMHCKTEGGIHLIGSRTLFIFSFSLLFLVLIHGAVGATWTSIKPAQAPEQVKLVVADKELTYYPLSSSKEVQVKINGPCRLKVVTRGEMPAKQSKVTYQISARRDQVKDYLITRSSGISAQAKPIKKDFAIGESRSVVFKVPKGEHTYTFSLPKGQKGSVYVRFLKEVKKGKKKATRASAKSQKGGTITPGGVGGIPATSEYVGFQPLKGSPEVPIIVKEEVFTYYRATANQPVTVEVIGPTELKVVSRMEIQPAMRGILNYRVQLEENGKTSATYPLKAKPSPLATYKESSPNVLSQGSTIMLPVPEGTHRYRFFTPDSGVSILFRFYIPRKHLGNEGPSSLTSPQEEGSLLGGSKRT